MAKSIMIQGTASGVGKTTLALALCRIFKQDGLSVAPFKAQNITANTCFTPSGQEIAVSQWLQALAAEVTPSSDMSPIVLKPSPGNQGTQIIANGKPFATINPYSFKEVKPQLAKIVADAYERLRAKHDLLVIEGAGSPVELNLKQDDIVNMGMAKYAGAPVLLVADIDRGGIFASLYGTLNLFTAPEKAHVKATVANRFMGDGALFKDGVALLEEITGLPVAGVVPAIPISLPQEDSLFEGDASLQPGSNFGEQFDSIANTVRKSLNMDLIYEIIRNGV